MFKCQTTPVHTIPLKIYNNNTVIQIKRRNSKTLLTRPTDRLLGTNEPGLHTFTYMMNKLDWHILQFLHFTYSRTGVDRLDGNFDSLWKIQNLLEILNRAVSKFYSASKCRAVGEFIVFFKGRLVPKHWIIYCIFKTCRYLFYFPKYAFYFIT